MARHLLSRRATGKTNIPLFQRAPASMRSAAVEALGLFDETVDRSDAIGRSGFQAGGGRNDVAESGLGAGGHHPEGHEPALPRRPRPPCRPHDETRRRWRCDDPPAAPGAPRPGRPRERPPPPPGQCCDRSARRSEGWDDRPESGPRSRRECRHWPPPRPAHRDHRPSPWSIAASCRVRAVVEAAWEPNAATTARAAYLLLPKG